MASTLTLPSLVSICDKSIIKPSSLTTPTLRYHKLSLIDQSLSNCYIPFSFFYPKKQRDEETSHHDAIISKNYDLSHISHLLQKSLSKNLVSYYPYAGRLRDNATVDCNDMGAEFSSVRIKCPMSEILNHPHADAEKIVFPEGLPWKNNYEGGNLLLARVNQFDCGGIAISICLSHKIGDGTSTINFLTDWARFSTDTTLVPAPRLFIGDSIYSPKDGPLIAPIIESNVDKCVKRRFIFSTAKLDTLRAKVAAESGVHNPTKPEIVSALLFKCATKAASKLSPAGSIRPSKLFHYLNLRPVLKPRLPRSSIGNLLSVFSTTATNEKEIELPRIVRDLRNEVELAVKKDQVKQNELVFEIEESMRQGRKPFENDEYDMYICSNLCKMPYYSLDFGLGKPERVCLPNGPSKNMFFLKDYQTGRGVEVEVMLQKEKMSVFEHDEELLEFASIPSFY